MDEKYIVQLECYEKDTRTWTRNKVPDLLLAQIAYFASLEKTTVEDLCLEGMLRVIEARREDETIDTLGRH
jgi:hypothetical protein